MAEQTVADRLRSEYFQLLPAAERVVEELETEARYTLLPVSLKLDRHERLVVTLRIKDCESALNALRRRQESRAFDLERVDSYTLTALPDLVGVRVLVFPRTRWIEVDGALRHRFPAWVPDPVPAGDDSGEPLAFKYHGYCRSSPQLRAELQVVPTLIGLFWQVEHSAIYKPSSQLSGVVQSLKMQQRTSAVIQALKAFEEEFEELVRRNPLSDQ